MAYDPSYLISFDMQDTASGEHLGTAKVVVGAVDEIGPLVADIIARNQHDDFSIIIDVVAP